MKKLFWLFFPIVLGGITGFIIKGFMDYDFLIKPPFSPKGIIFPIAWSIIYLLMGISYYLFRKDYFNESVIKTYYLQLGFNILWSFIFFVFKLRLLSVIWILILDILVLILFKKYLKVKKISAYLIIPYIIWIIFATYLNIGIYILN